MFRESRYRARSSERYLKELLFLLARAVNELNKEDTRYFLPYRNQILPTPFERPYITLFKLSISPKSVKKRLHNYYFKKPLLRTESILGKTNSALLRFDNHLRNPPIKWTAFELAYFKVHSVFRVGISINSRKCWKIVSQHLLFLEHYNFHLAKSTYINIKIRTSISTL